MSCDVPRLPTTTPSSRERLASRVDPAHGSVGQDHPVLEIRNGVTAPRALVRLGEQRMVVRMDPLDQLLQPDLDRRRVELEQAAELLRDDDPAGRELGLPAADAGDVLGLGEPCLALRDRLLVALPLAQVGDQAEHSDRPAVDLEAR